ncbi:efflux transporter outer membrane subunit [Uliginosibacterium gangwonense]|uniref:efflux transporter outer membrane subunit n=1 Tax=Uliginosibacterium gangwonense TaxID=392736 RepID=UPI00036D01BE|nr:efflux transporter outer membrane subunit [Uliginosibacterium gangwonense]
MKQGHLSAAIVALILSGCSTMLTPAYERPDAPVPQNWPTQGSYEGAIFEGQTPAIDTGWKYFIRDERLRTLVEMALANNRDLRIAALNVKRARAAYGISRADVFPSISATGTATHAKGARDVVGNQASRISHNYSATLGFASYELDFFGKIQNQTDASYEAWLQLAETRDASQISLIAQVISGFLNLAADKERLKLAQDTFTSLEDSLRLTLKRHELKVSSQIDVTSAQASLEAARVDIANYRTAVAQDENALALLIGAPVPAHLHPPLGLFDDATILEEVPTGLSSDILLRRPDLRADEHALKAANANIGAARAAFFPSITLTANVGTASTELGRLFNAGNGTWTFAPQINLPIFAGGRLQSSLDQAKVSREIQIATYEKDVQTAFREVADALAQRGTADDVLQAQQAQTDAYEKSYKLARLRYKNGVDSYLSMLVYQRSYYAAQLSLLSTRLSRQTNLVTLYKALGGGVSE